MKKWCVALSVMAGFVAWCGNVSAAPLRFTEIQTKNRQTQKYTCATGKIFFR